jgi:hypothetical protein
MTNENSTLIAGADLPFRRAVERLHRRGPRVLAEFLDELGRERLIRFPIEQKLERYARLAPATLRALGGDRFPNFQIRLVNREGP